MAQIDLTKYGITGTAEIVHNPSYEELFEAEMDKICDATVAVICDKNTRISRICKRDSISSFQAFARIAAQHTDAFFCEKCDFVIENNSDVARLLAKVKKVYDRIKELDR